MEWMSINPTNSGRQALLAYLSCLSAWTTGTLDYRMGAAGVTRSREHSRPESMKHAERAYRSEQLEPRQKQRTTESYRNSPSVTAGY
jgi:hypothetical protein